MKSPVHCFLVAILALPSACPLIAAPLPLAAATAAN
jgi:hypothetical protein